MKKLLAIDTATSSASVALVSEGLLLGEINQQLQSTHSDHLLGMVDRLLSDSNIKISELDAIAVAKGPGSFTGLRVGMATAKGLALALSIPLYGVSTLEALASNLAYANMPVCAMLDARKNEVYVGLFNHHHGRMQLVGDEQVVDPEDLLGRLHGETLFVGDGALRYRSVILRHLAENAHFAGTPFHHPRAANIAWVAASEPTIDDGLSPDLLAPVYIRPSEAEKNLHK